MTSHSEPARDEARRNTRARFEQWAKNPACQANTVSAVHNVRMDAVAESIHVPKAFGQSPFALARGETFERNLFFKEAENLIGALVEKDVLSEGRRGLLDLRLKMNGGARIRTIDEAIDETKAFLRSLETSAGSRAPAVIAGATVRIPRGVMLPEAVLIIDALAIRTDGPRPEIIVGEIKTYPDRGGYTEARELATARAQAGIYLHALQLVVEQEGLTRVIDLAATGFLVLTWPGSNRPSVRAGEDLRFQAARAKRGFELLERAALEIPTVDQGATQGDLVRPVLAAPRAYNEACLSFCDLAARCFEEALRAGDSIVLGEEARRFLGDTTLSRMMELFDGGVPANVAEIDLMRRIQDVEGALA